MTLAERIALWACSHVGRSHVEVRGKRLCLDCLYDNPVLSQMACYAAAVEIVRYQRHGDRQKRRD